MTPMTRCFSRAAGMAVLLPVLLTGWAAGVAAQDAPGDPDVSGAVTLSEAIRIAYENQGSMIAAEESVTAAEERVRQARTGTLPNVVGDLAYQASGQTFRVAGSDFISSSTSSGGVQPRVALNFPLFDGGLTRAAVRQAQANVVATEASLASVENSLAFLVSVDYFSQLRADRTLVLRREQERLAQEQLNSVEARIAAEDVAPADRALPLAELRNRQVDRVQAENDLRVAAVRLRNTMGLGAGPPLLLVEPATTDPALPPLEVLLETAEAQRPEIVQAQARVQSTQESVRIAGINRRPRLDTGVSYSVTPADDDRRQEWLIGTSISMPLFDSGLTRARENEARAQERIALADLEQTIKDVSAEVETAYSNVSSARERVGASQLAVDAARVNLDVATERYNLGAAGSTVLDLITAQVQFATASNNAIEALYDLRVAQAQLDQALGIPRQNSSL